MVFPAWRGGAATYSDLAHARQTSLLHIDTTLGAQCRTVPYTLLLYLYHEVALRQHAVQQLAGLLGGHHGQVGHLGAGQARSAGSRVNQYCLDDTMLSMKIVQLVSFDRCAPRLAAWPGQQRGAGANSGVAQSQFTNTATLTDPNAAMGHVRRAGGP